METNGYILVERSIVFLRQEQLSLLHGLHLEILSLQKRCTGFDLRMSPPTDLTMYPTEEEQLEARCQEVEGHLQEQQQIQSDLRWELSQKSVLVGTFRASLKEKERRFLEELKHRSHRTTVLNTELQKQTEAAAYLSFQLHSAKQKLHQQRQQQHRRPAQSGVDKPPVHPSPQASASNPTTIKPKRRSSSRPSSHIHTERARECVPRERVMGPEEPMAMPDPAVFFYPYRHRSRLRPPHRHALQEAEGEESEELDQGASVSRLFWIEVCCFQKKKS
uniref:Si:dkey-54n8.4 n=1 Tax=Cyprinus carpio TaxID=7962 RepID=A0A8C1SJL4_CYPCA